MSAIKSPRQVIGGGFFVFQLPIAPLNFSWACALHLTKPIYPGFAYMKHHLTSLALLLLAGCGKAPKIELPLTGEYETGPTIVANPIVMYTENGPVNNPQLVDKFLSGKQLGPPFFFRTDVPNNDFYAFKLTIATNSQATLVSQSLTNPATKKAEITARNAEYFVLTEVDSVSISNSNTNSNRCSLLGHKLKTIYPAQRCKSLPLSTGYSQICRFRPVQVVTIRDGRFFLSVLSWMVQTGPSAATGSFCGLSSAGERNTFNPAIAAQLIDGDTIVVQQREIALLKK